MPPDGKEEGRPSHRTASSTPIQFETKETGMQPLQVTPHVEATAYHLNKTKDSQHDALQVAMRLVDELPFTATDLHIIRMQPAFRWGVRLDVLRDDSALFNEVAAALGAKRVADVASIGGRSVSGHDLLIGEVDGVPFEIRAYMGTQLVAVA